MLGKMLIWTARVVAAVSLLAGRFRAVCRARSAAAFSTRSAREVRRGQRGAGGARQKSWPRLLGVHGQLNPTTGKLTGRANGDLIHETSSNPTQETEKI